MKATKVSEQMVEQRNGPCVKIGATRVVLTEDPFKRMDDQAVWGVPPGSAHWIHCSAASSPPVVTAYRCRFEIDSASTIRIHVSADERYELILDGRRIGRGPERGDPQHWMYETYDLPLEVGAHVLVARVWALGTAFQLAPQAQLSHGLGFLLAAETTFADRLNTGVAPWQVTVIEGYTFQPTDVWTEAWFVGSECCIDGRCYPWGIEGGGDAEQPCVWHPVRVGRAGCHGGFSFGATGRDLHLRPAMLPAMIEEPRCGGRVRFATQLDDPADVHDAVDPTAHDAVLAAAWQDMLDGAASVTVPAGRYVRVLLDLEQYYCGYPVIVCSGGSGARLHVRLSEALAASPEANDHHKTHRDQVAGFYFHGFGDHYIADGGARRRFEPLWWRAGRFVEVCVQTAESSLTVDAFEIRETRYPLESESEVVCSDARWRGAEAVMLRTLQSCSHETYMDCPYYEQLMYVGDTRVQALSTYAVTADDRLPRKALCAFDWSRQPTGLTQARYPCTVTQIIPPFSLWWVAMVHDFMMWRGDLAFVRGLMPGVRAVLEYFRQFVQVDGLLGRVPGWNFVDWVPRWKHGIPPNAQHGPNGTLNWHFVFTLLVKSELERWVGEVGLADRDRALASRVAEAAVRAFWNDARELFADDPAHGQFSEHAQCLALLSGALEPRMQAQAAHSLFTDAELSRTTIYFSHYLFETARLTGCEQVLFERLDDWLALPARGGGGMGPAQADIAR